MSISLTTLSSQMPSDVGLNQYRYRLEFVRASDGRRLDAGFMNPSWTEFWREQAIFQAQRKGILGPDPIPGHRERTSATFGRVRRIASRAFSLRQP